MTLEEAIKHADEKATDLERRAESLCEMPGIYNGEEVQACIDCANEHRQLAIWLRELQLYKQIAHDEKIEVNKEIADESSEPYEESTDDGDETLIPAAMAEIIAGGILPQEMIDEVKNGQLREEK